MQCLPGIAIAVALATVVAGAQPAAAAGGAIYAFVDSRGITHFTNIPKDDRYVPVTPPRQTILPSQSSRAGKAKAPRYEGYDGLIRLTAREHDVPPALVKAVIAAESRFDPGAVSRKGAQGLMQLMPQTAAALGVDDPLAAEENVRGGTRYLREMLDRYGDMTTAVAAYNAGPTAVDRYRGVPPYTETRDYVQRVLTYYRHYHGDFGR